MVVETYRAAANQVAGDLKTLREVIMLTAASTTWDERGTSAEYLRKRKMFKDGSNFCPICKCECVGEEEKHRHMEEMHDNLNSRDQELMEKTSGKELLNE